MKILGITLTGIVLGYLIGAFLGQSEVASSGSFVAFISGEAIIASFALRGAIIGGIIAGAFGIYLEVT